MKKLLCGLLCAVFGCGGAGEGADDDDQGVKQRSSAVAQWPTFTGDCQASWSHTVRALNSSGTSLMGFSLSDITPGVPGFHAYLTLDFDPQNLGQAMSVKRGGSGPEVKLLYIVANTTYSPFGATSGQVSGTVTVGRYEPGAGIAEITFNHVTLLGDDSVYAGSFRCGIDGTLKVTSFARTSMGSRCGDDHECGGNYSGMVCGNSSFVCEPGCHDDLNCPYPKRCNTQRAQCEG